MVNNKWFDITIALAGIVLLAATFVCILRRKLELITFTIYIAYSLICSISLFAMMHLLGQSEYAHAYYLHQAFSYLLEVSVCIQLAERVLKKNWIVLMIFGPVLTTVMVWSIVIFSVPKTVTDVVYPCYIATLLCGFSLFVIWLLQDKFEGKLEKPYSHITMIFGIFIALRFFLAYTNHYFNAQYWWLIGRLIPVTEDLFLFGILWALTCHWPNKIINFPKKMTVDDLMAVCRNCGTEYPNHRLWCKHYKRLTTAANKRN